MKKNKNNMLIGALILLVIGIGIGKAMADGLLDGVGGSGISNTNGYLGSKGLRLSDTASTTEDNFFFTRYSSITGSASQDFWRNDTGATVYLANIDVMTSGAATSSFFLDVATSSTSRVNHPFSYEAGRRNWQNISSSTVGLGAVMLPFHYDISTSTPKLNLTATSSRANVAIRPGQYLIVNLSNFNAPGGHSEPASSTNTGIKPVIWRAVFYATTTNAVAD